MRFKVELHREVRWFLRRECDSQERAAFFDQLERLRDDPVGLSGAIFDPAVSPYMLRYFRFGRYLAVFEIDVAKDQLVIRVCRRARQVGKNGPVGGE